MELKNYKKKIFFFVVIFFTLFLSHFHLQSNLIDMHISQGHWSQENANKGLINYFSSRAESYKDDIKITGSIHDRHKLRWAYKHYENEVYKKVLDNTSPKFTKHVINLHYSLWLFLGFLFLVLSISNKKKLENKKTYVVGAIYLLYVVYFMLSGNNWEYFTVIELATVSASIFFAIRKKILFFLIALFIAISNRESGVLISLIYPIINLSNFGKINVSNLKKEMLPIFLCPIFFIIINNQIFFNPEIYSKEFLLGSKEEGRAYLNNIFNENPYFIWGSFLEIVIIYSPIIFYFNEIIRSDLKKRLLLILIIYIAMILTASPLGNHLPFLITLPIILICSIKAYGALPRT